jgi:hypothetical protein
MIFQNDQSDLQTNPDEAYSQIQLTLTTKPKYVLQPNTDKGYNET